MRTRLADALGIDPSSVSVKGKTNEGVDAVGRGEAIAAPRGSTDRTSADRTSDVEAISESTLRSQPHRAASRRQRAHGALQLAARARPRRHLHPPHRGHRRRAVDQASPRRASSRTCAGSASTGTKGPTSAARAGPTASPSACISITSYANELLAARPCLLLFLRAAEARGGSPRDAGRGPAAALRRHLPRPVARGGAAAHRRGRARRRPLPRARAYRRLVPGSRSRRGHLQHRRHRRSGPRALRRPSRLQLRRGRRRCADGDHARDPRRGPHLEHAAAGAALPGARLRAAAVRAPLAGARARTTRRSRSATARRRWRSSASAAICRRR